MNKGHRFGFSGDGKDDKVSCGRIAPFTTRPTIGTTCFWNWKVSVLSILGFLLAGCQVSHPDLALDRILSKPNIDNGTVMLFCLDSKGVFAGIFNGIEDSTIYIGTVQGLHDTLSDNVLLHYNELSVKANTAIGDSTRIRFTCLSDSDVFFLSYYSDSGLTNPENIVASNWYDSLKTTATFRSSEIHNTMLLTIGTFGGFDLPLCVLPSLDGMEITVNHCRLKEYQRTSTQTKHRFAELFKPCL